MGKTFQRFLSGVMALLMILSTVSFAAPSLAGVADTAVEAPAFEAPAADLAADAPILHALEFTNGTEGIVYCRNWVNEHDAVNGYLRIYPGTAYQRLNDVHWNNSLSGLTIAADKLDDIQIKVRMTNFSADTYAGYVYTACNGGAWGGTNMTWKDAAGAAVSIVDGEWIVVSLKATMGANWTGLLTAHSTL